MLEMSLLGGYLPDQPDERDVLFGFAADLDLPAAASVLHPSVRVKGQRRTRSCVGQAVAQGIRLAYLSRGVACPDLSALSVYRHARNVDGIAGDSGSRIRSAIRAVRAVGIATEEAWPFMSAKVDTPVPFSALHSGHDRFGIRGYYRILTSRADNVRRALASGFPVVAGWQITKTFQRWTPSSPPVPAQQAPFVDGHAMIIGAYHADETFSLLNSWGADWGDSGVAIASEAFVAQATDVWAIDVGSRS
jgi:hypothetical protein